MGLEIKNTSSYLPNIAINNDYFEQYLDTSDEWITTRTGIRSRHFVSGEKNSDMIIKASQNLNLTQDDKAKIRSVIVSTLTPDSIMPNISSILQKKLELSEDIFCVDINMACSGFVGAMKIMEGILKDDELGIIIGSETLSQITNMHDRSTAVLFGDGAGCVLVEKNSDKSYYDFGTTSSDALSLQASNDKTNYISMDGKDVYRFAVNTLVKSIENVLFQMDKKPDDIDYFISHQANEKIIKSACKRWNISLDKFPMNLCTVGNTSSASIPILLDELNKSNTLKKGDNLILCGFGAGLMWVSCHVKF